jgi:hypothetical protein
LHPFLFLDVSTLPRFRPSLFNPLEQQHFHFRQETSLLSGYVEEMLRNPSFGVAPGMGKKRWVESQFYFFLF